jgi:hypothetical protein
MSRPINPRGRSRISIDGLAVPIDVEDGHHVPSLLWFSFPQRSGPTRERFREGYIGSNEGQLCQEALGMAVAVGPMTISQ